MTRIRNSKTLLKILSAVIAIVLWFAITYTEDPAISQSLTGVTLAVKGESELNANGFAIVNKDSFPTVSVVIRGSRSNVISALGEIYAEINVASIKQAGENVVSVTYSYPSNSVMLEKIKVREITVETESIVSLEIPVKTEVINREKNSGIIVKSESKTETVSVKGAQSAVYEISYAKAKIDASKITKTSEMECPYDFYNEEDEIVKEDNIIFKSRDAVTVENTVYEAMELPIKVVLDGEKRKDYGFAVKNMSAETVAVGLEDGVFAEYVEAAVVPQKEKNIYEAVLIAKEGVYIPEESTKITVTGEIVPKEQKEVAVTVEAVNVPSGTEVKIEPSERKIIVKTAEESISLKATVDISKMTQKEEVLPINIETDGDTDVIGTYSVTAKAEQGE